MKVSLITACYNSEKTIGRTIESILSQEYNNIEYIIIDGDSSDSTISIIDNYKNILKDILAISAPSDAVGEHLAAVQSIASIIVSIENMRVIHDDPIRAIIGLGGYEQDILSLTNAFQDIQFYFTKKGIIFDENEAGFVLII